MKKTQILAELGDIPESIYDELVGEAFEQAVCQLSEIRQLVGGGQLKKAAAVAHSLKGCFANLRLNEISSAARELELALKSGAQSDKIDARIRALAETLRPPG